MSAQRNNILFRHQPKQKFSHLETYNIFYSSQIFIKFHKTVPRRKKTEKLRNFVIYFH